MWILMENKMSAIDNDTGDEIYINLGPDGIIRVYRNAHVVATFTEMSDARKFIAELVARS